MKTIKERLLDADPIRYEPGVSAAQRELRRQAVTGAASTAAVGSRASRHSLIRVVTIMVIVTGILLLGGRMWPRLAFESYAAVRFEVRLAEDGPGPGLVEATLQGGQSIYLHSDAVLSNGDIARAEVLTGNAPGQFSVGVEFSPEGAQKIRAATESHLGKRMAILIDDQVVMAPVVRAPIGESAVITGNLTHEEAQRIVDGIVGN